MSINAVLLNKRSTLTEKKDTARRLVPPKSGKAVSYEKQGQGARKAQVVVLRSDRMQSPHSLEEERHLHQCRLSALLV
jgi:hypothetical protein